MYYYAAERHAFASEIAQTHFTNRDGKRPSIDDIRYAMDLAAHCDKLVGQAREEWERSK
jgi:hypothetical protein